MLKNWYTYEWWRRTVMIRFVFHFYNINLVSYYTFQFVSLNGKPCPVYKFTYWMKLQGRWIRKAGDTEITAKFELKPPPYPLVTSKFCTILCLSVTFSWPMLLTKHANWWNWLHHFQTYILVCDLINAEIKN
jgi:hypothetical protein